MINALTICFDWDDVLSPCNEKLLDMLFFDIGEKHFLEEITKWGNINPALDKRFEYLECERFYLTQTLYPGVKDALVRLKNDGCHIKIATACNYKYSSLRVQRILELLGDVVEPEDIMIVTSKSVIKADITLDDGLHNIKTSCCTYPVLMRRPWNKSETGILSVNTIEDFVSFVEDIILYSRKPKNPAIIAMVAPSGFGKSFLQSELLKDSGFTKIKATTTRARRPGESENAYNFISKEEFLVHIEQHDFLEYTFYNGEYYGTLKLEAALVPAGKKAIMVVDICGAISIKREHPSVITVFLDRNKEDAILSVIRRNIPDEEKARRISSMDIELKNKLLCDYVIDNNKDITVAVEKLKKILKCGH